MSGVNFSSVSRPEPVDLIINSYKIVGREETREVRNEMGPSHRITLLS